MQLCQKLIKKKQTRRKRKANLNSDLLDVCNTRNDDSHSAAPFYPDGRTSPFNQVGPSNFEIMEQCSHPNLTSPYMHNNAIDGKCSPALDKIQRKNLAPLTRKEKKQEQLLAKQAHQNEFKSLELINAERLKHQVEEYIKKRIEHLESMRDQADKFHQHRIDRQARLKTQALLQKQQV